MVGDFIAKLGKWISQLWAALKDLDPATQTNLALVFITFIIAYINWRLVRNTRKAHELEMRAYVNLIGLKMVIQRKPSSETDDKPYQLRAEAILENQGKTPARDFRVVTSPVLGDPNSPKFDEKPAHLEKTNSSILAAVRSVTASSLILDLSESELLQLLAGQTIVCISTKVEYRDVFNKRREFLARDVNHSRPVNWSRQATEQQDLAQLMKAHQQSMVWGTQPHKLGYTAN